MTDRELLQKLLYYMDDGCGAYSDDYRKLIEALRARLSQPEPEQVTFGVDALPKMEQREWQGLTENEIKHLWYEACQTDLELTSQLIVHLAKNIEAKLKEKNTWQLEQRLRKTLKKSQASGNG